MSVHILERGAITGALLAQLRTLNFGVGDNASPADANGNPVPFGWQGEPNADGTNFLPWFSLTPMPASGDSQTLDTLGGNGFWRCHYSLYGAGVNRNQTEMLMDRARNLLCNLGVDSPLVAAGESAHWVIDGVKCPALGSNQRVGQAIPYYYTQTDTYEVWVSEEK